jgi:hypothetical protein
MRQSKAARAHDLAEWFRVQAETAGARDMDLMARTALALERIARARQCRSFANDNMPAAKRRARR